MNKTTTGALKMRIGFWGPLYYNHNKEPPQNSIGNYLGPYSMQKDREAARPLLSLVVFLTACEFGVTCRFMVGYKWGYK